jgi:riboflavin synthase
MFTGLIEEVGNVHRIGAADCGMQLEVTAPMIAADLSEGDSVAVNGCCLTATTIHNGNLTFNLLEETLARTNLRILRSESPVNLERALAAAGRLGGHFVQGHIDAAARVLSSVARGADRRIEVELTAGFARYVVSRGSVALNGVSLTIAEVLPSSFAVWIIPHTRRQTNFESLQSEEIVNVEFDIIAKYVERMLPQIPL